MKKTVVLLAAHKLNNFIRDQYTKLVKATGEYLDVFLLLETDTEENQPEVLKDISYYPFDVESLNSLGYEPIAGTIIPGSNHFPVLQFYRDHPEYSYYWNIEYDVFFHGDWNILFKACRKIEADFLSAHLERLDQRPSWMWWTSLKFITLDIPESHYLKSFNPIYRISARALKAVDACLSAGNCGHHEVLIPTLLSYLGYSLRDLGGTGDFVLPGFRNLFYTSAPPLDSSYTGSTMRFRPLFDRKEIEKKQEDNKLYHPVKQ